MFVYENNTHLFVLANKENWQKSTQNEYHRMLASEYAFKKYEGKYKIVKDLSGIINQERFLTIKELGIVLNLIEEYME